MAMTLSLTRRSAPLPIASGPPVGLSPSFPYSTLPSPYHPSQPLSSKQIKKLAQIEEKQSKEYIKQPHELLKLNEKRAKINGSMNMYGMPGMGMGMGPMGMMGGMGGMGGMGMMGGPMMGGPMGMMSGGGMGMMGPMPSAYPGMGGIGGMGTMNPMMPMNGMGMGMYPGMGMGMMGGMGVGAPGMSGYGLPRYPGAYGSTGSMDPMGMGYSGTGAAANFVDDNPDVHRMEHAYRQSMPEQYGIGLGAMSGLAGGQGFGSLPGTQQMLYGRGGGYGGVGYNGPV